MTRSRVRCDLVVDPAASATRYGVATISRLLKIIGLFCRISSFLYVSFVKETCNFKEPTHRSHPISLIHDSLVNNARLVHGCDMSCFFIPQHLGSQVTKLARIPQRNKERKKERKKKNSATATVA